MFAPVFWTLTTWAAIAFTPISSAFYILGPALYTLPTLAIGLAYKDPDSDGANLGLTILVGLLSAPVLTMAYSFTGGYMSDSLLGYQLAAVLIAVLGGTDNAVGSTLVVLLMLLIGVYLMAGRPLQPIISALLVMAQPTDAPRPRQRALGAAKGASVNLPPLQDVPVPQVPARKLSKLEKVLVAHGLTDPEEVGKPVKGPVVSTHMVKVPSGSAPRLDLTSLARDLGVPAVSLNNNAGPGCVSLAIPNSTRQFFTLSKLLAGIDWAAAGKGKKLPVCFAVDASGAPIVDDLASWVQVIVAGTTGSGKSVAMNAIILSLMASGAQFGLMIADGKGDDFAPFYGKSKHLLRLPDVPSIARTANEAYIQLNALAAVMDARAADHRLPRVPIVYLIDELLDLLMAGDKKMRAALEDLLVRIAQKGRSFGILLLAATQTPSSKALPEPFRANVPTRLGLSTAKAAQSRIIIDEPGCEQLLGKGDGLLKKGSELTRVHCANVTPADMKRFLR